PNARSHNPHTRSISEADSATRIASLNSSQGAHHPHSKWSSQKQSFNQMRTADYRPPIQRRPSFPPTARQETCMKPKVIPLIFESPIVKWGREIPLTWP